MLRRFCFLVTVVTCAWTSLDLIPCVVQHANTLPHLHNNYQHRGPASPNDGRLLLLPSSSSSSGTAGPGTHSHEHSGSLVVPVSRRDHLAAAAHGAHSEDESVYVRGREREHGQSRGNRGFDFSTPDGRQ
jgi:hypothetical protein